MKADARGRKGLENRPYPQAEYLRGALRSIGAISSADFDDDNLKGAEIGQAIHTARLRALENYEADNQAPKK